jgi:hypothetical protein
MALSVLAGEKLSQLRRSRSRIPQTGLRAVMDSRLEQVRSGRELTGV